MSLGRLFESPIVVGNSGGCRGSNQDPYSRNYTPAFYRLSRRASLALIQIKWLSVSFPTNRLSSSIEMRSKLRNALRQIHSEGKRAEREKERGGRGGR